MKQQPTAGHTVSPSRLPEQTLNPLLQAGQITLFRHINSIINMLPMPHEVINFDVKSTATEEQYREKMEEFFADSNWHCAIHHLSKALLKYLASLHLLPWKKDIPEESVKDIGRFATLFLEVNFLVAAVNLITAGGMSLSKISANSPKHFVSEPLVF